MNEIGNYVESMKRLWNEACRLCKWVLLAVSDKPQNGEHERLVVGNWHLALETPSYNVAISVPTRTNTAKLWLKIGSESV